MIALARQFRSGLAKRSKEVALRNTLSLWTRRHGNPDCTLLNKILKPHRS
jgi:hypothetical protein